MKRLLLFVSLFLYSISWAQEFQGFQEPAKIKSYQYQMNGKWLPSIPDLHVGPENYTILKNLRPTSSGYETIEGWTKINTTATNTPVNLHHFTKEGESHVIVKTNNSGTYELYENITDIPNQGEFIGNSDGELKLLLHCDGTDAGTTFTDDGDTGHTVTAHGDAQLDTAYKKWGTASGLYDGTGDYLTIPDHADWDILSETNFTIDLWVRMSYAAGERTFIGQYDNINNYWMLYHYGGGAGVAFNVVSGGSSIVLTTTNETLDTTDWHHIALVKISNEYALYIDGTQYSYKSDADTDTIAGSLYIGSLDGSNYFQQGWLDEIRIYHGNLFGAAPVSELTDTIQIPTKATITDSLYEVNSGLGSFANGPQGTMFYVDDDYSLIWGGDELRIGAFLNGDDTENLKDYTQNVDNDLEDEYGIIGDGGINTDTKLMLHMDGVDASTTFTDDGNTGHTMTANGDAQLDTSYKKFGQSSGLFDGTGDYVSAADHADWDILSETNFTIDLWVKHDDHSGSEIYISHYEDSDNYWWLGHVDGTGLAFLVRSGASTIVYLNGGEITDTNLHHIALAKIGNEYGIYKDETQIAYASDSDTDTFTGSVYIGIRDGTNWPFDGWLDEVRIQYGNYFNAAPNVGLTDTINSPSIAYFDSGDYVYICSPLKLDGIKAYVATANTETSTLSGWAWNGQDWSSFTLTDNTASGGVSMAQTGTVTWTYDEGHDVLYISGLAMYVYRFQLSAGNATIYKTTLSAPLQPIRDLWNGAPRVITAFEANRNGVNEDYTFAVESQDSTTDAPYAATIGDIDGSDHLIVMSDDRLMGLSVAMVTDLLNAANAQIDAIYYWDGDSFVSVGYFNDNTLDTGGDSSFAQSGTITWSAPDADDEHAAELFGKIGYVYKITVDAALTDGTGHDGTSVDYISGITAPLELNGYNLVGYYNGRTMLVDGNRVDYSQTDTPWVYNGVDASDNRLNSLYFGDKNEIVAATSIFNRYGSNLIEAWIVLKKNATYVLTGSQPDLNYPEPFVIKNVSNTIGCAAPMTVVSAETDIGNNVRMNVVCWLDFAGPIIYDGTVPVRLPGLEKYFDPTDLECVNYSYIDQSVFYIDTVNNQLNMLFPTGSSTTNNKWIVYDFEDKKLFEKVPYNDAYLYNAAGVTDTDGARYNYGFLSTGYMMRLDNGADWDGNAIEQQIRTGIFSPEQLDDLGFWTESEIRAIKLLSEAIDEDQDVTISLYSEETGIPPSGYTLVDSADTSRALTFNNDTEISTTNKFGKNSLYFDGTGDSISTPDHADWDVLSETNFSIDLWVKHTDHAGTEYYISQYEDIDNYWAFRHVGGTGLQFLVNSGGSPVVSLSGGEISDTLWHHVLLSKVGNEYGLYLDGTQTAYVSDADTDTFAGLLYLGLSGGGTSALDGYMDEIRIYFGNPYSTTPVVGLTDTITVQTNEHALDSSTKLLIHVPQTETIALDSGGLISKNNIRNGNFSLKDDFFQIDFSTQTASDKWRPLAWGYKARLNSED